MEFLESERPTKNLCALVPVPLGPEEDDEEEEEEEVELDPFLGSSTAKSRFVSLAPQIERESQSIRNQEC